jgi:hypothetical protein
MTDTFIPLPLTELTEELATTLVVRESAYDLLRDHGVDDTTAAVNLVESLVDRIHDEYLHGADIPTLIGLIHGDLRRDADRYIAEEIDHLLNTHAYTDRAACATYATLNAWDTEQLTDEVLIGDKQRTAIAVRIRELLTDIVERMLADPTGYRTDLAADLAHYGYSI